MTQGTIRVGFVGAGNNTRRRHIPGFQKQPGVELVAVANRTKESGERVAREFGLARVYEDWRDLVRARDVDAVCIGTWPYMHCEITVAALEAGKHVLCEARMAMDAAEGRRMLAAARRASNLVAQLVPAPHTLEVDATLQSLLAELPGGAVAHLRFSSVTALAPPSEVWIFGREGTLRLEADARRLSGARRGEDGLREIPIPAERRSGWRVEEEFVNAIRGRETVRRTTFEVGRTASGSHEPRVRLAQLRQELVEALVLVEPAAHLVHRVGVGRHRPRRPAEPRRLDAPRGGVVEVDEVHQHVPRLPAIDSSLGRAAWPVEVGQRLPHDFVQIGEQRVLRSRGRHRRLLPTRSATNDHPTW